MPSGNVVVGRSMDMCNLPNYLCCFSLILVVDTTPQCTATAHSHTRADVNTVNVAVRWRCTDVRSADYLSS